MGRGEGNLLLPTCNGKPLSAADGAPAAAGAAFADAVEAQAAAGSGADRSTGRSEPASATLTRVRREHGVSPLNWLQPLEERLYYDVHCCMLHLPKGLVDRGGGPHTILHRPSGDWYAHLGM